MLRTWRGCLNILRSSNPQTRVLPSKFSSFQPKILYPASVLVPCSDQNFQQVRFKGKYGKGKKHVKDEDEDFEEYDGDEKHVDRHTKVLKVSVNSLRADLIVKTGLGLARNKVEALFYESKIRVNGEKLMKKSAQVAVGDEIDVVKGVSQMNPDHLVVQRVEVLSAVPKEESDGLSVNLRRQKSLIIENYENNPFKEGSSEN